MKHALSLTAFGTVTGLLFCFYALPKYKILFIAVALCTGIAALVIYFLNHKSRAEAAMAAVVFISAAVAGIYNVLYTHVRVDAVKELVGKNVQVSGTVVDVYGEGYCRITLSGKINGVKCRMSFYNPEPIEYGSEVTLSALISEITDLEDMLYSYPDRQYVNLDSVRVQKVEDAKGLAKAFSGIRIYSRNVSQRLVSVCGKESGGILAAMLCGNTSFVDRDIRTDMSRAGIGHVLAVSGLHVSVIAGFIAIIMKRFGRIISFICSEAVMVLFVIFSGAKISSIRALIMMSVLLFSNLLLQEYSGKESIALCIMIMSVTNPYIVASPSFILSVSGVFGAGTAASAVIDSYRIKSKLLQAITVSACAAACTLPAVVCFFAEVSLVSVAANLLLLPLCSAALCLSMIFAVMGCPSVLEIIVTIASKLIEIVTKVSGIISSLNISWIGVKCRWITVILVLLGVVVVVIYLFSRSIKSTTKAAIAAYFAAIAILICTAAVENHLVYMNIETKNGGFVCTVSKGESSVMIVSDEGLFYTYTDSISKEDLSGTELAIILKDSENGSVIMKQMDSDGQSYALSRCDDTGIDVSVFGIEIKASPAAAEIVHGGGRIYIASRENNSDADVSISVFDGVSVINDEDGVWIVEGELEREFRLKARRGANYFDS